MLKWLTKLFGRKKTFYTGFDGCPLQITKGKENTIYVQLISDNEQSSIVQPFVLTKEECENDSLTVKMRRTGHCDSEVYVELVEVKLNEETI